MQGSLVSFKQQPKNVAAPSLAPYRICSDPKPQKLQLKPTRHQAKQPLINYRGSHRQYRHPGKGLVVTVPGHLGKDVPVGTLKAILRSAGLEETKG